MKRRYPLGFILVASLLLPSLLSAQEGEVDSTNEGLTDTTLHYGFRAALSGAGYSPRLIMTHDISGSPMEEPDTTEHSAIGIQYDISFFRYFQTSALDLEMGFGFTAGSLFTPLSLSSLSGYMDWGIWLNPIDRLKIKLAVRGGAVNFRIESDGVAYNRSGLFIGPQVTIGYPFSKPWAEYRIELGFGMLHYSGGTILMQDGHMYRTATAESAFLEQPTIRLGMSAWPH